MRKSCNGCRVLRKGCSDSCALRPCLQWIKSSESQENATLFLSKFYGRSGLLNLINSGPEESRPIIFRSLLYEACGRLVNPTFGSLGLLWSGKWQICQSAVESILRGSYPFRHYNIYQAMSTRLPLRGHRFHSASSEVQFRLPASTRDASLGEEGKYLGPLTPHPQVGNLRWRRCYNIPKEFQGSRITILSGGCTGAESENIDCPGSRTYHVVSNENSRGNGVDDPDEKGDANFLMGMQAETQKTSCAELESKRDITDLELELRLGSRDCYNSCDPTLSQPPSDNSSTPSAF